MAATPSRPGSPPCRSTSNARRASASRRCPMANGRRSISSTAIRPAANGATEAELNAIFGWTDCRMASHYTKKANRKKLAYAGVAKLERMSGSMDHRANVYSLTDRLGAGIRAKAHSDQMAIQRMVGTTELTNAPRPTWKSCWSSPVGPCPAVATRRSRLHRSPFGESRGERPDKRSGTLASSHARRWRTIS
jgi:hypothetical protein